MNSLFNPTDDELEMLKSIKPHLNSDFTCFRLTKTMLKKSIIDATFPIRNILKNNNIMDFDDIDQGEKFYTDCIIINNQGIHEITSSFYRPKTKQGDPRFWPKNFKNFVHEMELILFTSIDDKGIFVTIDTANREEILFLFQQLIKKPKDEILSKLENELNIIKNKGWIDSCNPNTKIDKDVGLTLESELGILPNSFGIPDFLGQIELKSKRKQTKTLSSLFAKTPDWNESTKYYNTEYDYLGAGYYLLEFGIESQKHPGFKTLYVTVSSVPNRQGMYLETNDKREVLFQHFTRYGNILASCIWDYSVLKNSLLKKHKKTVWIIADERNEKGRWQFKYESFEFSEKPSFNQFISLIPLNIITLDWTHRIFPDGTQYNDHGFLFRIKPDYRELLFSSIRPICV